ncbi:uncharacterized protein LOC113509157 isoform X2 [Galleria mellonella]|uniref:Uncharacterized protein LOC113509157 isoform X2 n=1 Tax=Galleria mellonella TaxID=7137 RepID=A0ABM3MK04_GALME|nr:uncharacterized protein LOC113509157 isoform X2 [Galleria mellonella]
MAILHRALFTWFIFLVFLILLCLSAAEIKNSGVTKVSAGDTAVLKCISNDYKHNFMFWLIDQTKIIGPGNEYDKNKYSYEVLSGNLKIHAVTPDEAGYYKCISKDISGSGGITVGEVEMVVGGAKFSASEAVKLIAMVVSIIIIIACAVIYFRLRKEWSKYDGRTAVPVDDTEDGDEIYNQTTTTINQPVAGPSRNPSSEQLLYGIDNQGLDTDFNSVFENIQIKSPQRSLI